MPVATADPPTPTLDLGLLTIPEVVEALGGETNFVTAYTVRQLIRTKKLKAVRLGGTEQNPRKLRVRKDDLREFCDGLPARTTAADAKGGAA